MLASCQDKRDHLRDECSRKVETAMKDLFSAVGRLYGAFHTYVVGSYRQRRHGRLNEDDYIQTHRGLVT